METQVIIYSEIQLFSTLLGMLCCPLNKQTDNISQSSDMKTENNVKSENKKTKGKKKKIQKQRKK